MASAIEPVHDTCSSVVVLAKIPVIMCYLFAYLTWACVSFASCIIMALHGSAWGSPACALHDEGLIYEKLNSSREHTVGMGCMHIQLLF